MDTNQQNLTLEESIKQVMQTLPPPIRSYLAQGKYSVVARNLVFKYQLRVDQGGVLEREIMLLLMGIENPAEFTQALAAEAGLDQKTIDGIAQDVNDQIFVPLREEMKKEPSVEVKPLQVPTAPRHLINKIQIPENKMQRPIVGEKLLEDHEEPSPSLKATEGTAHIELGKMPLAPPRPVPPPPNLSGAVPPAAPPPSRPVARPYTADPYREPIDEGQV